MSKIQFIIFLTILFCAPAKAVTSLSHRVDSLYREVDIAISKADTYTAQRQQRITALQGKLKASRDAKQRYDLCFSLFEEYTPLATDSAIYYLYKMVDLSEQEGWKARQGECMSMIAFRCSSSGMYDESRSCLQKVDTTALDADGWAAYYRAQYHLASELAFYAVVPQMRDHYNSASARYERLLLEHTAMDDDVNIALREITALNSGKLKESMEINNLWLKNVEHGSHRFALVAFYRYLEYSALNQEEEMIYWLLESTLADVRNGVMDQGSMWELCNQLMRKGYTDRSYNYISFASHCAARFGSRQRNWRIAPLMSDIADRYKTAADQKTRQLMGRGVRT